MGTEKVETGPLLAGGYGDKLNYDVCKTATVYEQRAFLTGKDDTLNKKKTKELVRDNLIQSYTEAFKPQQTKKNLLHFNQNPTYLHLTQGKTCRK